jgi:uncharacterized glyoxalase superfamily protein PhnB
MSTHAIIPTFRYDDAHAAITFLCDAFGFERHVVYPDEDGGVAHAQLTLGGAMIMLGTTRDDAFGQHQRPPSQLGGKNSSSLYIVVADADAAWDRARAAHARVVMPLEDWDHGGRGFTVADPEGVLWSFGTFDPQAQQEA